MVRNPQLPLVRRILSLLSATLRGMRKKYPIEITSEIQELIDDGKLLPPQEWNLPSLSLESEKLLDEEMQEALDEIREDLI